jgi:hypothetical protein
MKLGYFLIFAMAFSCIRNAPEMIPAIIPASEQTLQRAPWVSSLDLFLHQVLHGEFPKAHGLLSSRWKSRTTVAQFQKDFESMSLPKEKCEFIQTVLKGAPPFKGDDLLRVLDLGENHQVTMQFENSAWVIDSIE